MTGFDPPELRWVDVDGDTQSPPEKALAAGESERFLVRVHAWAGAHLWVLLHLFVDGCRETFTVDDDGRPFRTVGLSGLPSLRWYGGAWSVP